MARVVHKKSSKGERKTGVLKLSSQVKPPRQATARLFGTFSLSFGRLVWSPWLVHSAHHSTGNSPVLVVRLGWQICIKE
jgi:hypothetical protein